jgi:glycosyltransferase involved in cell wall biosynthesis
MPDHPRFSVIIPTYNREHLLPLAVKSVLTQSFDDFELVISNGGSTDNTKEVVSAIDDPRIRYIESTGKLTAGDNYQQGLNAATGELITFLSDDDAYAPNLLEYVDQIQKNYKAEIIGYPYCRYYHDEAEEFGFAISKNSLLVPKFDGSVTQFTAEQALDQVFRMSGLSSVRDNPRFIAPYLSNAVCSSRVLEKLGRISPKLFKTIPPDVYLTAAVFMVGVSYFCVDVPLLIWSSWNGNMTARVDRGISAVKEHYEKLLAGRGLHFTPLKFALPANCGINAVLEAASDFGLKREINWENYFLFMYEYLTNMKNAGIDTSKELAEFETILAGQDVKLRAAVKSRLKSVKLSPKGLLSRFLPSAAFSALRRMRRTTDASPKVLDGALYRFDNVYEAGRQAAKEVDSQLSKRTVTSKMDI